METPITDWTKVKDILSIRPSSHEEGLAPEYAYNDEVTDELIKLTELFKPKKYIVLVEYKTIVKEYNGEHTETKESMTYNDKLLLNPDAEFLYHYYEKYLNKIIYHNHYTPDYLNKVDQPYLEKYVKVERIRIGSNPYNRYVDEYVSNSQYTCDRLNNSDYKDIITCLENIRGQHNYKIPGKGIVVSSLIAKYIQGSDRLDRLPIDYLPYKYDDYNILYFGLFYDIPVGVYSGIQNSDKNIYNDKLQVIGTYDKLDNYDATKELSNQIEDIIELNELNNIVVSKNLYDFLSTKYGFDLAGIGDYSQEYVNILNMGTNSYWDNGELKKYKIYVIDLLDINDNEIFTIEDIKDIKSIKKIDNIKFLDLDKIMKFNKK